MKLDTIQMRDPFVFVDRDHSQYFLFGSTDSNIWSGPGTGFDCYRSQNLEDWEGPIPAFRPDSSFWGTTQYWAPEVHEYRGAFYMFATFAGQNRLRGTQVLKADRVQGPFVPWSSGPVTPSAWQCLDGSLYVEGDGNPWLVFCQEWTQVSNGGMWAIRLSDDLRHPIGRPVYLFSASDAEWVRTCPDATSPRDFDAFVTDGPFLHRTALGDLVMLWSSFGEDGYAMGLARSSNGTLQGDWTQATEPLWAANGGHGMIFTDLRDQLFMTLHTPNETPAERARFIPLSDTGHELTLADLNG